MAPDINRQEQLVSARDGMRTAQRPVGSLTLGLREV